MCIVVLLVAVGLLLFYLDGHLANWELVERLDAHSEITLAVGWEMISGLWPLILATVLLTLAAVMLYLNLTQKRSLGCATCPTDKD
jgi:hypothetical protein